MCAKTRIGYTHTHIHKSRRSCRGTQRDNACPFRCQIVSLSLEHGFLTAVFYLQDAHVVPALTHKSSIMMRCCRRDWIHNTTTKCLCPSLAHDGNLQSLLGWTALISFFSLYFSIPFTRSPLPPSLLLLSSLSFFSPFSSLPLFSWLSSYKEPLRE